jgi:hypothetical protein
VRTWIAALAVASSSCAGAAAQENVSARQNERRVLNDIADRCRVPRTIFKLGDRGELMIRPRPDWTFEQVDCALLGAREAGFSAERMGFVGNMAPEPKSSNDQ